MLAFYISTYMLPFISHIFTTWETGMILLGFSTVSLMVFFVQDVFVFQSDTITLYSITDYVLILIHIFYSTIYYYSDHENWVDDPETWQLSDFQLRMKAARSWVITVELVFGVIKMQYYMRVNPEYGKLIQLLEQVFYDLFNFTLLFIANMAYFSLVNYVLEIEVLQREEDGSVYTDHPDVPIFMSYFIS